MRSPQRIECRGVRVLLGWRTDGRGTKDSSTVYEETLFAGELPIGEQEYPFQATIPLGPISYAGHYININWFVSAHIDLAWQRDPKTERLLHVTLA